MPTDSYGIEIIKVIGALAWPALIVGLVITFYKPLRKVAESLAAKVADANKLSVGSLSFEIGVKARQAGGLEFAEQVGTLSAAAVRAMLRCPPGQKTLLGTTRVDESNWYSLPDEQELGGLAELESKGFLIFRHPLRPFLEKVRELPVSEYETGRVWHKHQFPINSAEDRGFMEQTYSLTAKGHQASETIANAVAAQLARDAADGQR